MAWSRSEDETLRQMWMSPQRYSAAEIAAQLGGRSRSAVIGRINRRIHAGETELRRMDPMNRAQRRRVKIGRPRKPVDPGLQPGSNSARRPGRPPLDRSKINEAPERAGAYDAASLRQPLTGLTPRQCRYPVNDPDPDALPGTREEFLFCGMKAQPGSSYCAHHHLRCYGRRKYDVEVEFASETHGGKRPARAPGGKREAAPAKLPACAPANPEIHLTEKPI